MIVSHFERLRRHKAYVERRNLPVRTIVQEAGISQGAILRVKNVAMARISLSTLEILCHYFNVKGLSELIEYFPYDKSPGGPDPSDLPVRPQNRNPRRLPG